MRKQQHVGIKSKIFHYQANATTTWLCYLTHAHTQSKHICVQILHTYKHHIRTTVYQQQEDP